MKESAYIVFNDDNPLHCQNLLLEPTIEDRVMSITYDPNPGGYSQQLFLNLNQVKYVELYTEGSDEENVGD